MSQIEAQIHAITATFSSLQSQLEALLMAVAGYQAPKPPVDPAETCPHCGASGDSQADTSTLDGTKRRKCTECGQERVL